MQTVSIPSRSMMPLQVERMPLSWLSHEPSEQRVVGYRVWGESKGFATYMVERHENGRSWRVMSRRYTAPGSWALESVRDSREGAIGCAEALEAREFNGAQPDPRT